MTFAQRFTLVLMAAFFLSTVATSLAGCVFAGAVLRASARASATARAWTIAAYRLLPAAAAFGITAFILGPGYYRHEQRGEPENAGLVLALCAAGGVLILLRSAARAARGILSTRALRRAWIAASRPLDIAGSGMPAFAIDSPFPLVAVLGVFRPRLFLSTSVLRACSPGEIAAIIEHERRHASAGDNAVRLLMDAAPDALGFSRAPGALAAAWHHAAEHRADEAAARRLDLASALVRVARMAGDARPMVPASALYRGDSIEDRVKRLVGEGPGAARTRPIGAIGAAAAMLALALAGTAMSARASEWAHTLLEAAVSLP